MDSVFQTIDKSYSNKSELWIQGNLNYHDTLKNSYTVLIHSSFMIHSSAKNYKARLFVLTTDKLYCFKVISYQPQNLKSPGKFTFISWKKVKPFQELSDSKVKFGMRIIGGFKSVDLYTEDSDLLEKWLNLLSGLCVMADFSNDYEILNCINKGYFSDVYKAYCHDTSQIVAVKAISKSELMTSPYSLDSLTQEINTMRKMKSRRILKLRRVYETSDRVYLITDFFKGGDLLTRINKRKNFTEKNAALIITGILTAVKELHDSGIMHRDLKLDNILLHDEASDIDFTISDFGLAANISHNDGLICGSPGYIAPEMLRSQEYNEKVDIFSIGVILYIL
jgi:tRNA A-37 threonylcarbamoyl transferase component Bud32